MSTLAEIEAAADATIEEIFQRHGEAAFRDGERRVIARLLDSPVHVLATGGGAFMDATTRTLIRARAVSVWLRADIELMLARVGRRSMCLDAPGIMLATGMLDLRAGDAVLALAYGRAYREVTGLFGEARRLRLPVVLVSDAAESTLAKFADVVLVIPRGKRQRVALHSGTLVGLESMVLALATTNGEQAVATLERLNTLRIGLSGQRYDVG